MPLAPKLQPFKSNMSSHKAITSYDHVWMEYAMSFHIRSQQCTMNLGHH